MRQCAVDPQPPPDPAPPDTGLRTLLRWTLLALVGSILFAMAGVYLAMRYLDRPG